MSATRRPSRRRHRHGRGDAAGQRRRRPSGRALVAGESGVRTIDGLRPVAGHQPASPARCATSTRRACSTARRSGATTATRSSRSSPRARRWTSAGLPERLEGELADETGAIIGSGLGGTGTLFEQIAHQRRRAGRTGCRPFFIPMAIANMAAGQVGHLVRRDGPQLRDGQRLRHRRPCHRRGDRDDPARRRRGDARRRLRGARVRGARRRLRRDARAVDAQRRPGRRQPAVRRGPRRLRHRRGRRRCSCSRSSATPSGAARRSWPRCCGYGATADASHITLPAPGGDGARARRPTRAGQGRHRRRRDRPRQRPRHVARRRATRPSWPAFRTLFGDHARNGQHHRDQERHRAHARRGRRHRRRRQRSCAMRDGLRAADAQPGRPDRRRSDGLDLTPLDGPRARPSRSASSTRSASAARTRPSSSGAGTRLSDGRATRDVDTPSCIALIDRLEGAARALRRWPSSRSRPAARRIVLRSAGASAAQRSPAPPAARRPTADDGRTRQRPPSRPSRKRSRPRLIVAPLTGLFYKSPSPGAEPYVREGGEVDRRPGHRADRGDEAVQRDQERRRRPCRAHLRRGRRRSSRPSKPLIELSDRCEDGHAPERPHHRLGHVRARARADQRRARARRRHVRRVDPDAHRHPRAARRRRRTRRPPRWRRSPASGPSPSPASSPTTSTSSSSPRSRPTTGCPRPAPWSRRPSATQTAAAMDVMAACSGFVYAYSVADAYIRSGMFKNALVIGAETAHALPRLLRPHHLHPLRRRRGRGRPVRLRRGGRRPAAAWS